MIPAFPNKLRLCLVIVFARFLSSEIIVVGLTLLSQLLRPQKSVIVLVEEVGPDMSRQPMAHLSLCVPALFVRNLQKQRCKQTN